MNFSDKISEDLALRTDLNHYTTNKKVQQPVKAIFPMGFKTEQLLQSSP